MKRVFVEGYTSNNLGDDLFFYSLTKRYLTTKFIFNFGDKSNILKSFTNVEIGHYRFKQMLFGVQKFDFFVIIGGSMFQQFKRQPWFKKWFMLLLKVVLFKLFKKKVVFIGFNFGPYYSKIFQLCYGFLFSLVDYLSVRDNQTFTLFRNNKKVHLFPDIVFSLPKIRTDQKRRSLAISVMDFGKGKRFQKEYEEFLIYIINRIDPAIKITLYGFQISDKINDDKIIDNINKKVKRKVSAYCYNGNNMDLFLQDYYKNFFAITTRFHSLVLSLKAKQQIISIDYNIKVKHLRTTLDIKNMDIEINDFTNNDITSQIIEKINKAEVTDSDYLSDKELHTVMNQATNHFEYLDSLLRGNDEKNNL